MKKFSKILSVALLVALVLSLGITNAFAADSYPITINNANATAKHTYTAYQVFAGTLDKNANGEDILTNIVWGDGVNGGALLTELKTINAYKDCADAAAVAKVLEGFSDNSAELEAFAEIVGKHLATGTESTASADFKTYTIDPGKPGYYIIKETGVNPESTRSSSGFMIDVVGPATANVKDNPMTPDKNILIANGADPSQFTKVKENTANVGDTVNFVVDQIKVPSTDGYKTFKFVMRDTLPKGLTFGAIVSVKLDKNGAALDASAYTVTTKTNTDGSTELRIAIKNALTALKPYEGKEVEIQYTATVNKEANFGNTGNKNEVVFEFTNNPSDEHEGDDFGPDEPHGISPKSETITYVTKIVVMKVDDKNAALAGAVFKLSGEAKNVVVTTGQHFVEATDGTYYLLKDGTYTTTAPTNGTADKYADTTKKYKLENYQRTELQGKNNVDIEAVSGTDGKIIYEGLKPGTYTLTETGAPVGFNKIENPFSFTIKFDSNTKKFAFDGTPTDGVVMKDDGTVEINVVNHSGAVLPSTGGIGTTIFYVVGGVLVLAAIILLVTKKRMSE